MVVDALVHIVDDDPDVRESLQLLVDSVGLSTRAYCSSQEFLENYSKDSNAPACMVLDIRMPGMSGMKLHEKLVSQGVTLPVIIITGYGDVPTAVNAMRAGVVDFIEKPFHRQTLLDRIWEAVKQDGQRRELEAQRELFEEELATLTAREREVMDLMIAGETAKQSSARFGVSVKTVLKHRARVLEKLQLENAVDLVHLAYRCGRLPNAEPHVSEL